MASSGSVLLVGGGVRLAAVPPMLSWPPAGHELWALREKGELRALRGKGELLTPWPRDDTRNASSGTVGGDGQWSSRVAAGKVHPKVRPARAATGEAHAEARLAHGRRQRKKKEEIPQLNDMWALG
jgi:hypothetical protein